MRSSDTFEPEMIFASASARTKFVMCGAAGVVVGGLAIGLVLHREPARDKVIAQRSELEPDPAIVRYRFAITGADISADPAATIKALEARIAQLDSPFETAELADLYFRRAQLEGDKQDYDTAEAMAKRSLGLLHTPNPALLTLAKLANARHQFREAIELAREHKQRSSSTQIVLATAYLALGELGDASSAANAAVEIKPDIGAYQMRALVMQAQGRDTEAAFDFTNAARVEEPGDVQGSARTRALWGRFLLHRGEYAGASLLFAEAVRIVPGFPLGLELQGELALRTGHAKEASALFEQAFAASRQVRYLIDQARAQELAGDRVGADALRAQVEVIVRGELGEGGLGHRLDLVEVLIDRNKPEQFAEAVVLAKEEVGKRGSFEARFQLARALARVGNRDEALAQVQAALANGTHEAQLYELASRLEGQRGNVQRAAMYKRLADKLDPGNSGWRSMGMTR
jgi:Tfp pilus assembly protein PilF